MCGIAGIMMRDDQAPARAVLDRLEAALLHRGPDGTGRFVKKNVALISTRLAIVDPEGGAQPISGPNGAMLVANAEIYNDPVLRRELVCAPFTTGSDCEPIVHLYARTDVRFADRLRGMYALAIYDPVLARLVLARDPFGIKPLYYAETSQFFAFASEPQALLKAGLVKPDVRPCNRAELLQLKFGTGADTIFSGIRRVLPGETLIIENARIVDRKIRVALSPRRPRQEQRTESLKTLDSILADSVSVHLRSDVPYGLFLSGGVDSSALLRLMQRVSGRQIQALTIGYDGTVEMDESAEAIRIADAVGAKCHRVQMGPAEFWAIAPRVAAAIDDPTTDAAALPTFMLGQAAAAQGLKVVLSGEGADELFGGYARHRRARWLFRWLRRKPRSRGVLDAHKPLNTALHGWRNGLQAIERSKVWDWSIVQIEQAIDCAAWLPNDLLTKLDRCLMVHGVEGRTPFIDPVVAAFAFGLPDDHKVGVRLGKTLLRDWLAAEMPAARPYAKKKGFNPPVGRWMAVRADELGHLVASQPGVAEIAEPNVIARIFHEAGRHPQPAWSMLFYALWHNHHILGRDCEGNVTQALSGTGS